MIEINNQNIDEFNKFYFKSDFAETNETFLYKNVEMPYSHVAAAFEKIKTDSNNVWEIAKNCYENNLRLSPNLAKKVEVALHSGESEYWEAFLKTGYSKINSSCSDSTMNKVREAFQEDRRFRGRTPGIVDSIARWVDTYGHSEDIARNFVVEDVRNLMSLKISPADVASLYMLLPKASLDAISNNFEIVDVVASELGKYLVNNRKDKIDKADAHLRCARWIANHSASSMDMINDVVSNATSIFTSDREITVPKMKALLNECEALSEVKKIEKAYKKPGFKLADCVCELKQCKVEKGRYTAYIMDGVDPRQVMLGEATDCCQCLGDAGETSMMHGLLNPKAGFFVIEETSTGIIKAQAESWEYNEDTLVFDNIEFAHDAPIDTYKDILAVWLLRSEYKNVAMGMGYNELNNDSFKEAPSMVPPVTPYEIYVMSYEDEADIPDYYERTAPHKREHDSYDELMELPSVEVARQYLEEGRINYYDYLYSDTDDNKGLVWLKENERVSEYFEADRFALVNEVNEDEPVLQKYAEFISDYYDKHKEEELDDDYER